MFDRLLSTEEDRQVAIVPERLENKAERVPAYVGVPIVGKTTRRSQRQA